MAAPFAVRGLEHLSSAKPRRTYCDNPTLGARSGARIDRNNQGMSVVSGSLGVAPLQGTGSAAPTQSASALANNAATSALGKLIGCADDVRITGTMMADGLGYQAMVDTAGKLHDPEHNLDNKPVPTLQNPTVIVPGYTSQTSRYKPLVDHLTKDGANGGEPYYVKQGKFYTMDQCDKLHPLDKPPTDGKVFEMVFSDARNGPQQNLPEMRANMDAISKATGHDKLDTIGHSLGGLDTREYLDQGGDHVNRFMMLGTPNHGSAMGNQALTMLTDNVRLGQKVADVSQDDTAALKAMRGDNSNQFLNNLNSPQRWQAQEARTAGVATVSNGLLPTAMGTHGLIGLGDGVVTSGSVKMPGATNYTDNEIIDHGHMPTSPEIYDSMQDFFQWK
jgi:pimeloyl-ACP methyl ester carboxylesterase